MARPALPEASRRRLAETVERLRALVPDDWNVTIGHRKPDLGVITIAGDDGTEAVVSVLTRERLEPRDLDRLQLPDGPAIVSAAWLSPRSREVLRESGISFLDSTGNAELRLRRPALYVRTDGASRDPNPKPTSGPTLRGRRVWALMRTLIDVAPPYTAGDLSSALDMNNGYVSRVLQALVDERLITRPPRGAVTDVKWEALLRHLARTYSFFAANETTTWVAPTALEPLLDELAEAKAGRWAVTGSFAASSIVASPQVAVLYADDPERLAKVGRLLPTKVGANVVLAKPYDPIVFERGWRDTGFPSVSVSQAAIDSLTGGANTTAAGKAVVDWMRRNEALWRSFTTRG